MALSTMPAASAGSIRFWRALRMEGSEAQDAGADAAGVSFCSSEGRLRSDVLRLVVTKLGQRTEAPTFALLSSRLG
jgi:hypothetical protein